MPRALISVYDKTGIVEFAESLINIGWDVVASSGTAQVLREAGLNVTPVEQLTGTPEILGRRVKTLHPAIHAGILARDTQQDLDQLAQIGYAPISMVVCNLYPFQARATSHGASLQDAIEYIDIGGETLLRAAAKNFFHVIVICSPDDYEVVFNILRVNSLVDLALKRDLAVKAFAYTRDYDTAIHAFLARGRRTQTGIHAVIDELPEKLSLGMQRIEMLRHGENPHQRAAYYNHQSSGGPLGGNLLNGKQLSYNNIIDLDTAWRTVSAFSAATVAIVKHRMPVGIAEAKSSTEAYPRALATDTISASGGVIAVNRPVDDAFVNILGILFLEAIAAPSFSESALQLLASKRPNCSLLSIPQPHDGSEPELRTVHKGLLVQTSDTGDPEGKILKTVTQRVPTVEELNSLQFAWQAVQHVKSNSIVLAVGGMTVGISGGLPNRVDAVELALAKAGDRVKGAVMASDGFFSDTATLEIAINAGVTAVIQPGGSIRDGEIISAANMAGMAMVHTGTWHLRH
jgi:phosphoribosylaminoimidazolecarboxamide formyltransferase / IMP cyclohydrolase